MQLPLQPLRQDPVLVQVGYPAGAVGTREDVTRAVSEGAQTGRRGDPPTACPYPNTSLLRGVWVRGYARARPLAPTEDEAASASAEAATPRTT
ncbi:Rmf/CrpP fold protein [Streptomyces sp. NPDC059278]|uniref:Rmf/CrpP fold protein n=1 Tax=Streptomyces sp. NPDC059278 TaxID=3346801 RepID=UPI0036BD1303